MSGLKDLVFSSGAQYQGTVDERFKDLASHFSRLQAGRTMQGGAALSVYYQGELVVDLYTGMQSNQREWQADTLSICYSTGKGVLSTLAHILVSQGLCDYDTPILQYWPSFAKPNSDKANITLRHILCHQTGLFDIRNNIAVAAEMADWSHMLEVMERAEPRFKVGKDSAYQALTYGWLLGAVLEKVSKRTVAQLIDDELVQPLGLDGAYFGVPTEQLSRVAIPLQSPAQTQQSAQNSSSQPAQATTNSESSTQATQMTSTTRRSKSRRKAKIPEKLLELSGQNPQDFLDAMVPRAMRDFSFFSPQAMQATIPAVNGAFTARSLAKIYAMLAQQGTWEGQQLISADSFAALSKIQSYKRDRVMPIPMKWRLGYHRVISLGKRVNAGFGHIGYNGSGAWCDPQRGLSFAYTHNFPVASITGDYRLWSLTQEALRCADAQLKGHKGWF